MSNFNHSTTFYSRVLQRDSLECPPNTTYLAMMCVTVRTVDSSSVEIKTSQKLCAKESKPFHLPGALNNHWQEKNKQFTETVRLFYIRWPSLYDYEFIIDDWLDERLIIEIDVHGESEAMAIDFSKSANFHLRLRQFNGSAPTTDTTLLNIVCGDAPSLANIMCLSGHFQCSDGTCILEHYTCDGRTDCPDLSDEEECSHLRSFYDLLVLEGKDCHSGCAPGVCTCHQLYFQCQYGGCVPWSRVCDGRNECPHGEDGQLCLFYQEDVTSSVSITQKPGAPVLATIGNLQDNSTKTPPGYENVHFFTPPSTEYEPFVLSGSSLHYFNRVHLCIHPDETTCLKNFYGDCFPRHRLCIFEPISLGRLGCVNGAHLRSCYFHSCPNFFKYPNDYCLPFHLVCNGVPDCPNAEDEDECQRMSFPGFFLCRLEQICIHPPDLSTSYTKCFKSKDDKTLVSAKSCPFQCECLGQAVRCHNIESLSSFQTSKYTRLIIMEGTTVVQNSFRWADVTSEFLMVLKVSGCEITSENARELIATCFLKRLNLSNIFIDQLDSRLFGHMENLETLDISHNMLRFLAFDFFKAAQRLDELVASYNRIGQVRCGFSHSRTHLKRLILNNNQIKSLHSVVACLNMFPNIHETNV